jgi:hypothetical protein
MSVQTTSPVVPAVFVVLAALVLLVPLVAWAVHCTFF